MKTFNHQATYQQASLGGYGHNIVSEGETTPSTKVYFSIQALEDSVVSYDSDLQNSEGDSSVTDLVLKSGISIVLGKAKPFNKVLPEVKAFFKASSVPLISSLISL